jgi:hypothetical protein
MGAWNMMSAPPDGMVVLNHDWPSNAALGNIKWWGLGAMGKVTDSLNVFGTVAQNFFEPSTSFRPDFQMGMLWTNYFPDERARHTGTGVYFGTRYDIEATRTKIGFEYNHGTKYWMPYGATSNDIWGNKLNTRGSAYEVYLIQELDDKPIAKRGKAFVKIGWQYYDFEYTGSLNWLEVPRKISSLTTHDTLGAGEQWFIPLRRATDLYITFDVLF